MTQAAAILPQGEKWLQDFLDFVSRNGAPMDFFSWHMYSNDPADFAEAARYYRNALHLHGFTRASKHITEWNTDIRKGSEAGRDSIALRAGCRGAAILTAVWIELQQQNDLEVSVFYRGNDPDVREPVFYGMFYADGRPKCTGRAFSLWSKMVQFPQQLAVNMPAGTPLRALAGISTSGQTALLITNPSSNAVSAGLSLTGGKKIEQISSLLISDANDRVESSCLNAAVTDIDANTVQLLIF